MHSAFFGVFFSTGIPTSSYFLAASNMGWEARRPDLARKFARMGAGRLGGLRVLIDWNTHFVVFSGGFEQGLGGSAARCSWKTRKNGGWEARRLDPAGMITPPPLLLQEPGPTRVVGRPKGSYMGIFLPLSGGGS